MALEVVQNQQPLQLVHISGGATSGDHDYGWSIAGFRQPFPVTLDLFHINNHPSSSHIELQEPSPLPIGFQKFLDLKTGEIYYTKMSHRNGNAPKLDLKLNLSPPRANFQVQSPSRSATVSPTSPPSSCVSSELNQDDNNRYSNSPEATSMVLVGCPRCLMYVMLAEVDPRCPKCKSSVLLDVFHDNNNNTTTNKKTRKN